MRGRMCRYDTCVLVERGNRPKRTCVGHSPPRQGERSSFHLVIGSVIDHRTAQAFSLCSAKVLTVAKGEEIQCGGKALAQFIESIAHQRSAQHIVMSEAFGEAALALTDDAMVHTQMHVCVH